MTAQDFFIIFLIFFILHELIEFSLDYLNYKNVKNKASSIPEFYKDKISQETYNKSTNYTLEKMRFSFVLSLIKIPIIFIAIQSSFFNQIEIFLLQFFKTGTYTFSVIYCFSIAILLLLMQIPSSIYNNFVIESKYGFNKMTAKTYIQDLIKSLLLSAILGLPILYLVFWLYSKMGNHWWIYSFVALFLFQFFIAAIYPVFLAPIFNKFIPLEDGSLKDSILSIAKKINFKLSGIYTIDGSKRSAHSNAYFAGMGRFRRIVLFDTIREQLDQDEIISVLAHEMGHNKKRHVQKQMVLSLFLGFISFWILSWLIDWQVFYDAFKAGEAAIHKGLVLFALFSGYFTFILTPLQNYISRKNEYEADAFSVEVTGKKEPMASSLIKLSKENLSNLNPHRFYSFYHYSHPTAKERVEAIQKI